MKLSPIDKYVLFILACYLVGQIIGTITLLVILRITGRI